MVIRKKFEIDTPNNKDENFVTAHIETAAECIPTKWRVKYSEVLMV